MSVIVLLSGLHCSESVHLLSSATIMKQEHDNTNSRNLLKVSPSTGKLSLFHHDTSRTSLRYPSCHRDVLLQERKRNIQDSHFQSSTLITSIQSHHSTSTLSSLYFLSILLKCCCSSPISQPEQREPNETIPSKKSVKCVTRCLS